MDRIRESEQKFPDFSYPVYKRDIARFAHDTRYE